MPGRKSIDGSPGLIPFNVQYCVLTDQEPLAISVGGSGQDAITGMQEFMPSLFGLYPQPAAAIQSICPRQTRRSSQAKTATNPVASR